MQFNYKVKYNYFLIGIGCIFLFNGNINIFDFLPDFIGYIFIAFGIGHLYLVNENFNKARQAAYYLILAALIKVAASFFTGGFSNEDRLLITAVFSVCEFILAYRLFGNLFKTDELYFEMNDSQNDAHDAAFYGLFMKIFLCVKYGVNLLAEMTVLINPDFLDRIAFDRGISIEASGVYRAAGLISVIIVTFFGLFMMTVIPPHFYRLNKNEAVNDKLKVMILSVENKDVIIKLRKYGISFFLLYISIVCLFDLKMDGIDVLPDVLSALAILAVLVNSRGFFSAEKYKKSAAVISALIAVSAAPFALNIYSVATEFERAFSGGNDTAINIAATALAIASNALFAAVYIFIFKAADRLRTEEMNLVKGSKGIYIPQEEFNRKINPKAVNAFIIAAFAVKSFSVLSITDSFVSFAYLIICIFCVIFSIYKLDKIRTRIRYYYQANSSPKNF